MRLTFKEYEDRAFDMARYEGKGTGTARAISYVGLGLGEAGEVQNQIKKILRDDNGQVTEQRKEAIIAELGDVCWYISALGKELGVSLEEIFERNLIKLESRAERDKIRGDGDYR